MNSQVLRDIHVERDDSGRVIRASGPGLVDLQINGCFGMSFNCSPEEMTVEKIEDGLGKLRERGVAAVLATICTAPADHMLGRVRRIVELRDRSELIAEMIPGFHIEGPMLSPSDGPRGAHDPHAIVAPADAPALADDLIEASGQRIRIFTLAPERDGAMNLIARLAAAGVVVSLGHHEADAATTAEAVEAGASMCTHLGNGSHAMIPRLDNYIEHQLADDRLVAGFIPDGHHIPFPTLKNFLRAKGVERSFFVSDAVAVAGLPPGVYGKDGGMNRVLTEDGAVRLEGSPYLSGSALTLDRGIINAAAHTDLSFETAWWLSSTRPAELVGLDKPPAVTVEVGGVRFRRV
jgi:N-acetylglucosamine-6-phosphate deacetylase